MHLVENLEKSELFGLDWIGYFSLCYYIYNGAEEKKKLMPKNKDIWGCRPPDVADID